MRKDWFPTCALIYVVVALVFQSVWDTDWWGTVIGVILIGAAVYGLFLFIMDWIRLR